jgi:nucleotide-binding universal stress UspA family protein
MENFTILVPTDFSAYTENALLHALDAGQNWHTGVLLLHLIDNEVKRPDANMQLQALAEKYAGEGVPIKTCCEIGKVMDIGKIAEEKGAKFIFMGTASPRGWGNIFGPGALRVSYNSHIPVIVTHLSRIPKSVHTIAVPVDKDVEDKQILQQIVRIGQFWKCEVLLVSAGYNDDFNIARVQRNVQFAQKYLDAAGIKNEHLSTTPETDYSEQLLKICKHHDANLIAFIAKRGTGVFNFGTNSFDEKLLFNPLKIPVLISTPNEALNPVDIFHVYN